MKIKLASAEILNYLINTGDLAKLKELRSGDIIFSDKNVENSSIASNVRYLADEAKLGDFVNYDAGIWTETEDKPQKPGMFGGYRAGTNKGMSLRNGKNGWRVMKIDHSDKTVTLVHAGVPELYHHRCGCSGNILRLNRRAMQYLNLDYAKDAHMLTKKEMEIFDIKNDLRTINILYFLVTVNEYNNLRFVDEDGYIDYYNYYGLCGSRPAVELKPNIQTNGQGEDIFGNKEAWQLVKTK